MVLTKKSMTEDKDFGVDWVTQDTMHIANHMTTKSFSDHCQICEISHTCMTGGKSRGSDIFDHGL